MPKRNSDNNPNLITTIAAIGAGALAGHVLGQVARPWVRNLMHFEAPAEAAKEAMSENAGFNLSLTPREILPGVALALFVRGSLGQDLRAIGGAAFLGSAVLTALAGTTYDEQLRSALKRFAPLGQYLA